MDAKLIVLILAIVIDATVTSPMFYKKKENDIYEPGETEWYDFSSKNKFRARDERTQ